MTVLDKIEKIYWNLIKKPYQVLIRLMKNKNKIIWKIKTKCAKMNKKYPF